MFKLPVRRVSCSVMFVAWRVRSYHTFPASPLQGAPMRGIFILGFIAYILFQLRGSLISHSLLEVQNDGYILSSRSSANLVSTKLKGYLVV